MQTSDSIHKAPMAFRMMNDELVFDAKTVFRSEAKVGQIQPAAIQEVLISTRGSADHPKAVATNVRALPTNVRARH
ncbi:hypothetical protein KC319_g38 [Hortaea werneckii]|nr:hypothetical protein KC319_g38 [Hortaea werneckii]